MKIQRLSKKSEPAQKTFTISATKESGLTPEQEVDVLYGRILANLFEVWENLGPHDFRENFRVDPQYMLCLRETGKDKFTDRLQNLLDFVLADLTIWNEEPVDVDTAIVCTVRINEDDSDSELPMTIIIDVTKK